MYMLSDRNFPFSSVMVLNVKTMKTIYLVKTIFLLLLIFSIFIQEKYFCRILIRQNVTMVMIHCLKFIWMCLKEFFIVTEMNSKTEHTENNSTDIETEGLDTLLCVCVFGVGGGGVKVVSISETREMSSCPFLLSNAMTKTILNSQFHFGVFLNSAV